MVVAAGGESGGVAVAFGERPASARAGEHPSGLVGRNLMKHVLGSPVAVTTLEAESVEVPKDDGDQ